MQGPLTAADVPLAKRGESLAAVGGSTERRPPARSDDDVLAAAQQLTRRSWGGPQEVKGEERGFENGKQETNWI